jgi:FG-GAP repeat protein
MSPISRLGRIVASFVLGSAVVEPVTHAQEVLGSWKGQIGWKAASDYFGQSVASLGDVDGDGISEVIIAAPKEDVTYLVEVGAVYVISGGTGTVLQHQVGPTADDIFGYRVCAPGDLDGDGVNDYLVGEPDLLLNGPGRVYGYSGATGVELFELDGQNVGDTFGIFLSGVGDVDGDGTPDFGVGAPRFSTPSTVGAGRVYVYSGRTRSGICLFNGSNTFGFMKTVCGVGDLDQDGVPDLGCGAYGDGPNGEGAFTVYSGASRTRLFSFQGEAKGDGFGIDVASLGDVDGDGYADYAVDAPGHKVLLGAEGRVYVYSGLSGALLWQYDGVLNDEQLGTLPTLGGVDFNGDGWDDITIASPIPRSKPYSGGNVCIYSGWTGTLLYDLRGGVYAGAGEGLGFSMSEVGDFNGDGFEDLLVGAAMYSDPNFGQGRAYVFGGNDLFIQANDNYFWPFDPITLENRGGAPGSATCIVLSDLNGTPTFVPLAFGTLDPNGNFLIAGTVPTGLSGMTLSFTGFAVAASGHGVADTMPETLTFE